MRVSIVDCDKSHYRSGGNRQTGFLLIESMVALVLFSIALLGLSALMVTDSKNSLSSLLRTETVIIMSEVVDTMRNNLAEVGNGLYNGSFDTSYSIPSGNASQAEQDIKRWTQSLKERTIGEVLEPEIEIDCTGTLNRVCALTISWDDSRAACQDERVDCKPQQSKKYTLESRVTL